MKKDFVVVTVGSGQYGNEKKYRVPKPVFEPVLAHGDRLDDRLGAHLKVDLRRGPIRIFRVPGGFRLDNAARNEEGVDGVFKSTQFGVMRQFLHWWQKEWQCRIVEAEKNRAPLPPYHTAWKRTRITETKEETVSV
jgi:hypothetical protein